MIKINGKSLVKGQINGKEIQKIVINGNTVYTSEVIDVNLNYNSINTNRGYTQNTGGNKSITNSNAKNSAIIVGLTSGTTVNSMTLPSGSTSLMDQSGTYYKIAISNNLPTTNFNVNLSCVSGYNGVTAIFFNNKINKVSLIEATNYFNKEFTNLNPNKTYAVINVSWDNYTNFGNAYPISLTIPSMSSGATKTGPSAAEVYGTQQSTSVSRLTGRVYYVVIKNATSFSWKITQSPSYSGKGIYTYLFELS